MSAWLSWAVLSVHYSLLLVLCLFGIHRLSMVTRWRKYGAIRPANTTKFQRLPKVTIQIPIFNERNVAERIIQRVAGMDYPAELLQIQVVDDSTDDTYDLIHQEVIRLQLQGLNIEHVHRTNRQGFKAGALRDAMNSASGEFIAIFDADFLPSEDFLHRTIHQFANPKVAMVQTRWAHLNLDRNRLTRTQGIMLDSHFALEQQVRSASGMLFNFNGTAGIWRTDAIVDAGHWAADTLTEDLDLSYRAQMRGWEMVYLNDIECPAELPSNMQAFKSQQHRWAKGGIQVMKKLLSTIWRSDFRLGKKLEATFHLSNNFAYFIMLLDTLLLLIPSLIAREVVNAPVLFWVDIPLLMMASGSHLVYLFYGQLAINKSSWNALIHMPWLLLLGISLAFNNARAALEALMNQESEFVRTPKSGEMEADSIADVSAKKKYQAVLPASEGVELGASLVFALAAVWAVTNLNWHMLPFLSLLAVGFSISAVISFRDRLAN